MKSNDFCSGWLAASLIVAASGQNALAADPLDTWHKRTPPPNASKHMNDIIHVNGQFVATAGQGQIFSSPDGLTWEKFTTPTQYILSSVAHGNGNYVAVGFNKVILTSPMAKPGRCVPRIRPNFTIAIRR